MKIEKLSKYEALRLVTPVIDDEVCNKTREVFLRNMKSYPEVNYSFKSGQTVKNLLQKRCPRAKASSDFHQRIKSVIALQKNKGLIKN